MKRQVLVNDRLILDDVVRNEEEKRAAFLQKFLLRTVAGLMLHMIVQVEILSFMNGTRFQKTSETW